MVTHSSRKKILLELLSNTQLHYSYQILTSFMGHLKFNVTKWLNLVLLCSVIWVLVILIVMISKELSFSSTRLLSLTQNMSKHSIKELQLDTSYKNINNLLKISNLLLVFKNQTPRFIKRIQKSYKNIIKLKRKTTKSLNNYHQKYLIMKPRRVVHPLKNRIRH